MLRVDLGVPLCVCVCVCVYVHVCVQDYKFDRLMYMYVKILYPNMMPH